MRMNFGKRKKQKDALTLQWAVMTTEICELVGTYIFICLAAMIN